jgi:hypothetical protein
VRVVITPQGIVFASVFCAAFLFFWRGGWRAVRTVDRLARLLLGDDKTKTPGLEQELATLKSELATIKTRTVELVPNSGSSLHDIVKALPETVHNLQTDVAALHLSIGDVRDDAQATRERFVVHEALSNMERTEVRQSIGRLDDQVSYLLLASAVPEQRTPQQDL